MNLVGLNLLAYLTFAISGASNNPHASHKVKTIPNSLAKLTQVGKCVATLREPYEIYKTVSAA
jgi:hypothetical protein